MRTNWEKNYFCEYFEFSDVAETNAKIADCLERLARSEPDKMLARTLARGADANLKIKKVKTGKNWRLLSW